MQLELFFKYSYILDRMLIHEILFQAAIRTGMELGALVNVQTNVRISTVTHSMAPVYTDAPILMLLPWTA